MQLARIEWRVLLVALGAFASIPFAQAQTLDDQYSFYLLNACVQMNFARVPGPGGVFVLAPGQAGPNLNAFCSRPQYVTSDSSGTTGSSTPSIAGAAGRSDDAALRRRRESQRDDERTQKAKQQNDADISLGSNFGAFLSVDYRKLDQDPTHFEGGRESTTTGTTLGIDYRFGHGLLGIAFKGSKLDGNYDSGGDFRSDTYGATLYGSWSPLNSLFIDLSAGASKASPESHRVVSFTETIAGATPSDPDTVITPQPPIQIEGDTDAQESSADVLIGYDIPLGRFSIGPRLGGSYRHVTTDAYREFGATGMTLAFDEQVEKSLRATIGLQASAALTLGGAVIVPQLNASYAHEYEDDQRTLNAQFAEDLRPNPTRLHFMDQSPDRDTYTVRASAVAVFAGGLGAFVSYEQLLAHDYIDQFSVSAGVRMEF